MKRELLAAALVAALAGTAGTVSAQTASDVHRHADAMVEQLERLRAADGLDGSLPAALSTEGRQPRHVQQQARLVYDRVQILRWLNGLPTSDLPPLAARQATPDEVMQVVSAAQTALAELAPVYGVAAVEELPPQRSGVGPAEVLARLQVAEAGLDSLGLPAIVPNDVYRVALAVRDRASRIAELRGVALPPEPATAGNEKPPQVLASGFDMLAALRALDAATGHTLPGGVAEAARTGDKVTPAMVIQVLQLGLADAHGLAVALGVNSPLAFAPQQSGRTPADSYRVMRHAEAIVTAITAAAGGA